MVGADATVPVRLEPNRSYEFRLNRGRFSSFMSEDARRLLPVHVTFRTGPARWNDAPDDPQHKKNEPPGAGGLES